MLKKKNNPSLEEVCGRWERVTGETPQVQQQPNQILDVRRQTYWALIKNQGGLIIFF